MTTDTFVAHLTRLRACAEAVDWARTQPDAKTAWGACQRGDWMLWLAGRAGVDRKQVVLAACDCAEPALVHLADDASLLACVWAIDSARRWARGETDSREVEAAAYAAYDAAYDAAAAYAAVAYAAAYAADAYAAYAAYAAAAAAAAYAAAYDAAAYAAAYAATSADLVREHIAWSDVERALEGAR